MMHYDPTFRSGRGETQRVRTLNKEAQTAHSLWLAMLTGRYCEAHPELHPGHKSRVHYDKIHTTLAGKAGTVLGELLHVAVMDARSRALPNPRAQMTAADSFAMIEWEMANFLADRQNHLDPPPQLVTDQSTHDRNNPDPVVLPVTARSGVAVAGPEDCCRFPFQPGVLVPFGDPTH